MEMQLFWNLILTLVILPVGWFMTKQHEKIEKLASLLNKTREDYIARSEHSMETDRILEYLRRLEDKIDRLAERPHQK